jgi:hypothetical protein
VDDIYNRWGTQRDVSKKWATLKSRLKLLIPNNGDVALEIAKGVAFDLGVDLSRVAWQSRNYRGEWHLGSHDLIDRTTDAFELAHTLEALIGNHYISESTSSIVAALVNEAGVGIQMTKAKRGWLSYPEGEKMLDEKVVVATLSFLRGKPQDEYEKALKHYTEKNWSESAERTRRTLEEFLRELLKNSRGLEQNIKPVGNWLKEKTDTPDHLRATVLNMLLTLDKNYNESSKHHSKTDSVESEYLIYQSAIILRLLSEIKSNNPVGVQG